MTIDPKATSFTIIQKGKLYNYFGLPIVIPKGYKWIAMDSDGEVYIYKAKPLLRFSYFNGSCVKVASVIDYKGSWKDSLIKVKDLPKLRT